MSITGWLSRALSHSPEAEERSTLNPQQDPSRLRPSERAPIFSRLQARQLRGLRGSLRTALATSHKKVCVLASPYSARAGRTAAYATGSPFAWPGSYSSGKELPLHLLAPRDRRHAGQQLVVRIGTDPVAERVDDHGPAGARRSSWRTSREPSADDETRPGPSSARWPPGWNCRCCSSDKYRLDRLHVARQAGDRQQVPAVAARECSASSRCRAWRRPARSSRSGAPSAWCGSSTSSPGARRRRRRGAPACRTAGRARTEPGRPTTGWPATVNAGFQSRS